MKLTHLIRIFRAGKELMHTRACEYEREVLDTVV
jgi:hypothetical protein